MKSGGYVRHSTWLREGEECYDEEHRPVSSCPYSFVFTVKNSVAGEFCLV